MNVKKVYDIMLFSIVVPVYNVENYIIECLDSIKNQDFNDYEIVIINDGSKDNSLRLCEEWAKNNYKICIKIISQENQGLGPARNTGIKQADGDYIIFIDSDDMLYSDKSLSMLSKFIEEFSLPDVVCYDKVQFDNLSKNEYSEKKHISKNINNYYYPKRINKMIKNNLFLVSAWSKVVKKNIIIDNNLYFNSIVSEDIDWTFRLLTYTYNIFYLNEKIYYYRANRSGSLTSNFDKILNGTTIALNNVNLYYIKIKNKESFFIRYYNSVYCGVVIMASKYKKNYDYIKHLSDYDKVVLKYSKNYKHKIISIAIRFLGLRIVYNILRRI